MCTSEIKERQQFSLGITSVNVKESEGDDMLKEFLNKTWNIFGVSILFNFYHDEVHLKQYAKRLREEIASNLTQQDVIYRTEFYIMKNITQRPSPTDPLPIMVEVHSENYNNEENSKKCIYKGVLLSWKTTKNELTSNCLRLPLLLCRGTQSAMTIVHNVLSYMFDCMILALPVQGDDLIWFIPIIITPTNEDEYPKSTDEICMEYRISRLPITDTISIKYRVSDLIKILTVIMKDQSDEESIEISFNLEHIEKFREVLYTQMLETAGLQLGYCTLYKINLPALTIMENKMKVMNSDAMNRVLLYLNKKALDTLHTVDFEVEPL